MSNLFQILEENYSFDRKLEAYTDSELNRLSNLFPDLDLYRARRRYFINIHIKGNKFIAEKYEDEWFVVKVKNPNSKYKDVLCDQIDGLIHLINSLINTNLLDDLFLRYSFFSYNDYIAENIDQNISYTEYISENIGQISYADYIAENINQNISYADYIAENIGR